MATIAPQRPELKVTAEAVRMETSTLVAQLSEILGTKLVAFLGGVSETRAVREWAEGERAPREESEERLRFAFVVVKLIATEESPRVARTWLMGLNPLLEDQSAARLIRDGDLEKIRPNVLAAARSFVVT